MALTTTTRYDNFLYDMENTFNRLFGSHVVQQRYGLCDCVEHENHFELVADLPGYSENDIIIEQQDGYLNIRAEKKNEYSKNNKHEKWHRRERVYSHFSRTFMLPDNVDSENISASLDKGILSVSLPKLKNIENKTVRRIQIQSQ